MPTAVTIPLLNPNEPEARLIKIYVQEGQTVEARDLLCTLETTKSVAEVITESNGFIRGLHSQEGDMVSAGSIFCYITSDPTWTPTQQDLGLSNSDLKRESMVPSHSSVPDGIRITEPAIALAKQLGIKLHDLPINQLITVNKVRTFHDQQARSPDYPKPSDNFDPVALVIFGGGGHGKSIIDLIRQLENYRIEGILDDGIPSGRVIMGIPVLGGEEALAELSKRGIRQVINAVGGIGNIAVRFKVFNKLSKAGFSFPTLIHPSAFIETSANLSQGVQVFAQSYIGSESKIGFGVIINSGAIVSHDCSIEDYANISPGAVLAGEVKIGKRVLVGMNATINLQVRIGCGARIGNGANVKEDVPENCIVRAGSIWPDVQQRE